MLAQFAHRVVFHNLPPEGARGLIKDATLFREVKESFRGSVRVSIYGKDASFECSLCSARLEECVICKVGEFAVLASLLVGTMRVGLVPRALWTFCSEAFNVC
jgi:hypothetical protein